MNRSLYFLGPVGSLFILPVHADDLSISTKTKTAVSTSSAANGSAGNITISGAGSVEISASGAAVTLDSNNTITNSGTISNAVGNGGEGVNILAGNTGSFTNAGTISLPGTLSAGLPISTTQYGVLLSGTGSFTGDIVTTSGSSISISAVGTTSGGIALQSGLLGNVTLGGSIKASGSGITGVSVSAPISDAFTNKGTISTDSGDTRTTAIHASPGSAVGIGGSVGGGILNAGPANGGDATARATISTVGTGPALLIAPSAGGSVADLAVGVYSDANNPGFSVLNRGAITADGNQPGVSTVGVRIGDTTGATFITTLSGGVYNSGTIRATAASSDSNATTVAAAASDATAFIVGGKSTIPNLINAAGTISAATGGPMGGGATALSIESGASLVSLNNSGTISADASTSDTSITSLTAYGIRDAAGTLTDIKNSGVISALATRLDSDAQSAIAADLSVGASVVTFLDSGTVNGDILFGTAPGNQLTIEGPQASVSGQVQASTGGGVDIAVSAGGTGGTLSSASVHASSLTVGPGGTVELQLTQDAGTVISSTGAVSFAAGSRLGLMPVAMLTSNGTYTLIHSSTALTFANFSASTAGATLPFLFSGQLNLDGQNLTLQVQRKTATQLGLSGTSAAIYEPAMTAVLQDAPLGAVLASLTSATEVASALTQFYPIVSSAPRDAAIAISESATNSVGARQYALATVSDQSSGAWGDVLQTSLKNTTSAGYDLSGTGFAVGFDWGIGGAGHFGTAFTYYRGTPNGTNDTGRAVDVEWSMGSLYAGLASEGAFVNAQLDFAFGSFQGRRDFTLGSLARVVSTNNWSGLLSSMGFSGGYVIDLDVLRVVPQVDMDIMTLSESRYNESGGGKGVDLAVSDRLKNSGRFFAGLGIDRDFQIGDFQLIPDMRAGWSHELQATPDDTVAAFQTDPITTFTVPGVAIETSEVVVDAKFEIALKNFTTTIGYDETVGSHSQTRSAKIDVLARF